MRSLIAISYVSPRSLQLDARPARQGVARRSESLARGLSPFRRSSSACSWWSSSSPCCSPEDSERPRRRSRRRAPRARPSCPGRAAMRTGSNDGRRLRTAATAQQQASGGAGGGSCGRRPGPPARERRPSCRPPAPSTRHRCRAAPRGPTTGRRATTSTPTRSRDLDARLRLSSPAATRCRRTGIGPG